MRCKQLSSRNYQAFSPSSYSGVLLQLKEKRQYFLTQNNALSNLSRTNTSAEITDPLVKNIIINEFNYLCEYLDTIQTINYFEDSEAQSEINISLQIVNDHTEKLTKIIKDFNIPLAELDSFYQNLSLYSLNFLFRLGDFESIITKVTDCREKNLHWYNEIADRCEFIYGLAQLNYALTQVDINPQKAQKSIETAKKTFNTFFQRYFPPQRFSLYSVSYTSPKFEPYMPVSSNFQAQYYWAWLQVWHKESEHSKNPSRNKHIIQFGDQILKLIERSSSSCLSETQKSNLLLTLETIYLKKKSFKKLSILYESVLSSKNLMAKTVEIALQWKDPVQCASYFANGLLLMGPEKDTFKTLLKYKNAPILESLSRKIIPIMQNPKHPVHFEAIRAAGLWFSMSHYSGSPFQNKVHTKLLPCGDIIHENESLDVTPTKQGIQNPQEIQCPCCNKHFTKQQLENPLPDILKVWRKTIDNYQTHVSSILPQEAKGPIYQVLAENIIFSDMTSSNKSAADTLKTLHPLVLNNLFRILLEWKRDSRYQELPWITKRLNETESFLKSAFIGETQKIVDTLNKLDQQEMTYFWSTILCSEDHKHSSILTLLTQNNFDVLDSLYKAELKTNINFKFTSISLQHFIASLNLDFNNLKDHNPHLFRSIQNAIARQLQLQPTSYPNEIQTIERALLNSQTSMLSNNEWINLLENDNLYFETTLFEKRNITAELATEWLTEALEQRKNKAVLMLFEGLNQSLTLTLEQLSQLQNIIKDVEDTGKKMKLTQLLNRHLYKDSISTIISENYYKLANQYLDSPLSIRPAFGQPDRTLTDASQAFFQHPFNLDDSDYLKLAATIIIKTPGSLPRSFSGNRNYPDQFKSFLIKRYIAQPEKLRSDPDIPYELDTFFTEMILTAFDDYSEDTIPNTSILNLRRTASHLNCSHFPAWKLASYTALCRINNPNYWTGFISNFEGYFSSWLKELAENGRWKELSKLLTVCNQRAESILTNSNLLAPTVGFYLCQRLPSIEEKESWQILFNKLEVSENFIRLRLCDTYFKTFFPNISDSQRETKQFIQKRIRSILHSSTRLPLNQTEKNLLVLLKFMCGGTLSAVWEDVLFCELKEINNKALWQAVIALFHTEFKKKLVFLSSQKNWTELQYLVSVSKENALDILTDSKIKSPSIAQDLCEQTLVPESEKPSWTALFNIVEKSDKYTPDLIKVFLDSKLENKEGFGKRIIQEKNLLSNSVIMQYIPYASCPEGTTWLHEMIIKGDAMFISEILSYQPNAVFIKNANNLSPLEYCCTLVRIKDPIIDLTLLNQIKTRLLNNIYGSKSKSAQDSDAFGLSTEARFELNNTLLKTNELLKDSSFNIEMLREWQHEIQQKLLIEDFQFTDTAADLSESMLKQVIGGSFCDTNNQPYSPELPLPFIKLLSSFLIFIEKNSNNSKITPLSNFEINTYIPLIKELLKKYEDSLNQLKQLLSKRLYLANKSVVKNPKKQDELCKELKARNVTLLEEKITNFEDEQTAEMKTHSFFTDSSESNFESFLTTHNLSSSQLATKKYFQNQTLESEDYQKAEENYLASLWKEIDSSYKLTIFPSGIWKEQPSLTIVSKQASNGIRVIQVDSGCGSCYHSGVDEKIKLNDQIVYKKSKKQPFMSQYLPNTSTDTPEWLKHLNFTSLTRKDVNGADYTPAHFYEVFWPMIDGMPDILDNKALSKTRGKSENSPLQIIKSMIFLALIKPHWLDQKVPDKESSKYLYKQFIVLFHLWIGATVLKHLKASKIEFPPNDILELSHKIASNCRKLLDKEKLESDLLMFLLAQGQKISADLSNKAHQLIADKWTPLPFELSEPLTASFSLPIGMPCTEATPPKEKKLMVSSSVPKLPTAKNWDGLISQMDFLKKNIIPSTHSHFVLHLIDAFSCNFWEIKTTLDSSNRLSDDNYEKLAQDLFQLNESYNQAYNEAKTSAKKIPIISTNKTLICFSLTTLVELCITKHSLLGPAFNDYTLCPSGLDNRLTSNFKSLFIANKTQHDLFYSIHQHFKELNKKKYLFLVSENNNKDKYQFTIDRNVENNIPFFKIINQLLIDQDQKIQLETKQRLPSPTPSDDGYSTDPDFIFEPGVISWKQAFEEDFDKKNIELEDIEVIKKCQLFESFYRYDLPIYIPMIKEWVTLALSAYFNKTYSKSIIAENQAYKYSISSVSVNTVTYMLHTDIFQHNNKTENVILHQINPSSTTIPAHTRAIAFINSEVKEQKMERLFVCIKTRLLNLENRDHQYYIRQILWEATYVPCTQLKQLHENQPDLFQGFCALFKAQFNSLKTKNRCVPAVAFLSEIAASFRSFSTNDHRKEWTELLREMREWMLKASQSPSMQNQKQSALFLTAVVASFSTQQSLENDSEAELLLKSLTLIKHFQIMGHDHRSDNLPDINATAVNEVMHSLFTSVEEMLTNDPTLLNHVVATRLDGTFEEKWTKDHKTNYWVQGNYAFCLLDGMIYKSGHELGTLPQYFTDTPHYKHYLGEAVFGSILENDGFYYSQKTDIPYRFTKNTQDTTLKMAPSSIKEKKESTPQPFELDLSSFVEIKDQWLSHEDILKKILLKIEPLEKNNPKSNTDKYNVYYNEKTRTYFLKSKDLEFKVIITGNADKTDIFACYKLYYKKGIKYESPIIENKINLLESVPEDQLEEPTIIIQSYQEGQWKEAVAPKVLEQHLPQCVTDIQDCPKLHYWMNDLIIEVVNPKTQHIYFELQKIESGVYIRTASKKHFVLNLSHYQNTNKAILDRLFQFEKSRYIQLEALGPPDSENKSDPFHLNFPRLGLTFERKNTEDGILWVSKDFKGFKIDSHGLKGLWPGFLTYLVLSPISTHVDYKFIIVPNQHALSESNYKPDKKNSIKNANNNYPKYFTFRQRKELQGSRDIDHLALAYLYFKTASLAKCPYSGLNGYETTSQILRTLCKKNSPYSDAEFCILKDIIEHSDNHRNALAIKLLAGSLFRYSQALPTFFPGKTKRFINKLPIDDYLSREQRVDDRCKLDIEHLKRISETNSTNNCLSVGSLNELLQAPISLNDIKYTAFSNKKLNTSNIWGLGNTTLEIKKYFFDMLNAIFSERFSQFDMDFILRNLALYNRKNSERICIIKILIKINQKRTLFSSSEFCPPILIDSTSQQFEMDETTICSDWLSDNIPYVLKENKQFGEKISTSKLTDLIKKFTIEVREELVSGFIPIPSYKTEIETNFTTMFFPQYSENQLQTLIKTWTGYFNKIINNATVARYIEKLVKKCNECPSPGQQSYLKINEDNQIFQPMDDLYKAARIDTSTVIEEYQAQIKEIATKMTESIITDSTLPSTLYSLIVEQLETNRFVIKDNAHTPLQREFPLKNYSLQFQSDLGQKNWKRLKDSWDKYLEKEIITYKLDQSISHTQEALQSQLDVILPLSKDLEKWIIKQFNTVPQGTLGWKLTISKNAGRGYFNRTEILHFLVNPNSILDKAPFLRNIKDYLTKSLLLLLQLETHAQHITRCLDLIDSINQTSAFETKLRDILQAKLCTELNAKRVFNPSEFPGALLLESENNLLIRKGQFDMALHILENPKELVQMQMGEGKSSVVMMLILIILNQMMLSQNNKSPQSNDSNKIQSIQTSILNILYPNLNSDVKEIKSTRLIIPQNLLPEMETLIKNRLGNAIQKRIFLFPFFRTLKTNITDEELTELKKQVDECKHHAHIILMTPEQRLSIHLTLIELLLDMKKKVNSTGKTSDYNQMEKRYEILYYFESQISFDILDEADQILSLITELNYSIGQKQLGLEDEIRQKVGLRFIYTLLFEPKIQKIINTIDTISRPIINNRHTLVFESEDAYTKELKHQLAKILINHFFSMSSPEDQAIYNDILGISCSVFISLKEFEGLIKSIAEIYPQFTQTSEIVISDFRMLWEVDRSEASKGHVEVSIKHMLGLLFKDISKLNIDKPTINTIIDKFIAFFFPGASENACIIYKATYKTIKDSENKPAPHNENKEIERKIATIRALAGWLSNEICPVIFGKRFHVDYGLTEGNESLCAVPFASKDKPIPNSTYEHPEVRIGYTILSYFYNGLDQKEIKTLFMDLDKMISKKDSKLAKWTRLKRNRDSAWTPTFLKWLDLHFEDSDHIKTLTEDFGTLSNVIAHYIQHIVFPKMGESPEKISASGTNIVHPPTNRFISGFSGTTTFAIPTEVTTKAMNEEIDGLMLYLLTHEENCQVYTQSLPTSSTQLLDTALTRLNEEISPKISIFLDLGALITGMTNKEVAHYLIKGIRENNNSSLKERYSGVVYFDDVTDKPMVATYEGETIQYVNAETNTTEINQLFTYFDDARCRGFDRKLPLYSKAILTLGKNKTDKHYSQAAMRCRNFGNGQTIELWIQDDVKSEIRRFKNQPDTSISIQDVAAWTVHNTVKTETAALRSQNKKYKNATDSKDIINKKQKDKAHKLKYNSGLPLENYDYITPYGLLEKTTIQTDQQAEVQTQQTKQAHDVERKYPPSQLPREEKTWKYDAIFKPGWINNQKVAAHLKSKLIRPDVKLPEKHIFDTIFISHNFWENLIDERFPTRPHPIEAYVEIQTDNSTHTIIVSGLEAQGIKKELLKSNKTNNTNETAIIRLRQLSDPTGPTLLTNETSLRRELSPDQKNTLMILVLLNGDSWLDSYSTGLAIHDDIDSANTKFYTYIQTLKEELKADDFKIFKLFIENLTKLRSYHGKKHLFEDSELKKITT